MSLTSADSAKTEPVRVDEIRNGSELVSAARSDALFARYKSGDEAAFADLYELHRGPVYRFFLRQVTASTAQDLCQETWIKLINAAPQYQPRGAFTAYLFKVAHNVLMDHFRSEHRRAQHMIEADVDTQPDDDRQREPDASYRQEQLGARLRHEITRLPLEQRSVWLIKQESGLDHKSIAAVTGISVEGVKSRLRYANEKLKAGLSRYVRS